MSTGERVVHLRQLPELRRSTGLRLRVIDGGRLDGADCTELDWQDVALVGDESYARSAIAILGGRGGGPMFDRCDFSGMRVRSLIPWRSRFSECAFEGVDVKLGLGSMHNDVLGCTFSGTWDGNFSARDGRRRYRIEGNDFRHLSGCGFYGGVDWRANQFDIGGRHLILTREASGTSAFRELAVDFLSLAMHASSLRGEGPIDYGQGWVLLDRHVTEEDGGSAVWTELARLLS